jgi:hypothetical protein
MKKALLIGAVVVAVSVGVVQKGNFWATEPGSVAAGSDQSIAAAFESHASNIQVGGEGTVIRVLADDVAGDRHQRFILRLSSGQTLLVAHNIDLAPRIDGLVEGDRVQFYGEYEWNDKGGVIHWTHHDPRGQHTSGWLKHRDRTYQ